VSKDIEYVSKDSFPALCQDIGSEGLDSIRLAMHPRNTSMALTTSFTSKGIKPNLLMLVVVWRFVCLELVHTTVTLYLRVNPKGSLECFIHAWSSVTIVPFGIVRLAKSVELAENHNTYTTFLSHRKKTFAPPSRFPSELFALAFAISSFRITPDKPLVLGLW